MVISRVDRALTHAGSGDPIAYTRETGSGVTIDLLIPHGKPGFAQARKTGGPAAIEFKLSSHQRACAASSSGPCREQDVSWHGFLWVSASTYLPTRLVMIGHHYKVGVEFGWLPPTSANLSLLHQRIPAGFRHV